MEIETNDTRIHIKQQGSGDLALVFLHYCGGSFRTWDGVANKLSDWYRPVTTVNFKGKHRE